METNNNALANALMERWAAASEALYDEEFEEDSFTDLCKDTFVFLKGFYLQDDIPRAVVDLVVAIKEFACGETYVSEEANAAQLIADAFCEQMGSAGWFAIDGDIRDDQFIVQNAYGEYIAIDASTFSLDELI